MKRLVKQIERVTTLLRSLRECVAILARIEQRVQKRFKLQRKYSLLSLAVVLGLLFYFSDAIITVRVINFGAHQPFYLSRVERRMAEYDEPMRVAFERLLSDYIEWHDRETRFNNNNNTGSTVRILAWNGYGESGLGDKIRGILHAFTLAIETRRYFVIEDVPEFPLRNFLLPRNINWAYHNNTTGVTADLNEHPLYNWRTTFSRGRKGIRRLSMPLFEARHKDHRVVRLQSSSHPMYERIVSTTHWRTACHRLLPNTIHDPRCGYLGDNNIWFNRQLFHALFKLSDNLQRQVDTLAQRLPSDSFIAVHARLGGKFRSEAKSKRFAPLNADWNATADSLLRCADIDIDAPTIYLATDDEDFKPAFVRRVHSHRKTISVVVSDTIITHSGNAEADQVYAALNSALVEGLFLGTARKLVTTGSGLANFAAFSGSTQIVMLDQCTNNNNNNNTNNE